MDERCKQYHSALSRCAELLDNMKDGDPITEVPQFLAAKLKQCQLAGAARQGGITSIEELTRYDGFCSYDGGGPAEMEVSKVGQYVKFDDVAAHLAGQSQATRAVPVAWMRENGKECKTDADVKHMASLEFGHWKEIAARYTIPLYLAAPTAREVTQQAAKAETAEQALNGIPATMRHDEGAIARCFYCGRYSLDRATLGPDSTQPVCECGKQHGWSGSFKRPGPDAKWSGKAPDLAPTTSTVSAPEEVRNQALEEAAKACEARIKNPNPKTWGMSEDAAYDAEDMACAAAIRALKRTTSGKGEAA